jgi:hypothetical protein
MWGRLLVAFLVLFGVWYYLSHRQTSEMRPTASEAAAGATAPHDCILMADKANASLVAAAALVTHPPVYPAEWMHAESDAGAAISAADSACSSSRDAQKALNLMRSTLSDLASAARGEGGAVEVANRQAEIDVLLDKVRGR